MTTTRPRRPVRRRKTTLRFTPTAWAKLLFLRDAGDTEIGAFGLSRPGDLLCVEDLVLVSQETGPAAVVFDDLAVAEFFEQQIDRGRQPAQFGRIWIHTHPGTSPQPSFVDEETFDRVFGRCDWAVMAILARGGASYARLHWNSPPGGAWRIPVEIDYAGPFAGSDWAAWQEEYERSVRPWFSQGALPVAANIDPDLDGAQRLTEISAEADLEQLFDFTCDGGRHDC